jgi:hypothetical protein
MTKKQSVMAKLGEVQKLVPTQDALAFMKAIMEAKRDETQSRVEMQKVMAAREVALTQIKLKHDLYRQVFDRIFDERRDAIAKHFDIIDRGIASNNQELILGALKGLGQIVAASPFSDLKVLAGALEGGAKIEI